MTMDHATIDGHHVQWQEPVTILRAAADLGIHIPALCYSPAWPPEGGCRLCSVQVKGSASTVAACTTPLAPGMVVHTATPKLEALRRGLLELIASENPGGAFEPSAEGTQFEALLESYGVGKSTFSAAEFAPLHDSGMHPFVIDDSHPYLRFDRSRCIVCRRCLNACDHIQGQFVYGIEGRGGRARLIFGPTKHFVDSPCVACGACVNHCPTGAISDRDRMPATQGLKTVDTTCGYCGVGCRVRVQSRDNAVVRIDGVPGSAVSQGHLCVKGRYAHAYQRSPERLTTPLLRDGSGELHSIGWNEANAWLSRRLIELRDRFGPDALGAVTSARSTNEAAYLLQKLFRTAIGTNNVDCCARVCHSSTAVALQRMTGTSGGSASFDDIEKSRCIIVAGSNPTEAHPVVGARLKQAALRDTPLMVIDPRRIELVDYATLHLPVRPGTNVPLFNAIAKVLIEEQLHDAGYVAARCEGFDALAAHLTGQSLDRLAAPTGVPVADIQRAARMLGRLRPALFVHGIGLSELTQGTASVMALVNLGMLTGSIGRTGGGMLPLRGQNNVQGNADMGAAPDRVTGNQKLDDPAVVERLTAVWGKPPPQRRGHTVPEMIEAAASGNLRGLWVQGFDLSQSLNGESRTLEAVQHLDLLVVQDIFPCALSRHAHLVLPAAAGLEQDGTFTNAERRIQLVRPAVMPPGEARPEWKIIADIALTLGQRWGYAHASDVMEEIAKVAPDVFGGVRHRRLADGGLQWPCPSAEHPGTATLHAHGFVRGRGRLMTLEYVPSPEQTSDQYPYVLITGRRLEHFNVGTMTRRTLNQELVSADFLEIHPDDAAREGLSDGNFVELASRWGKTQVPLQVSNRPARGTLFLTFHHPRSHTNAVTSPHRDPESKCPEYKVTAVRILAVATDGRG